MAIARGGIAGDISGALGGVEFAKGRGGMVLKKRKSRQSSTSGARTLAQAFHTSMVASWKARTDAQRLAWDVAARSRLRSDRFGVRRAGNGFQLFMSMQMVIYPFHTIYPVYTPPHQSLSADKAIVVEANVPNHVNVWTEDVSGIAAYLVAVYIGRFRPTSGSGRCYTWKKIGMIQSGTPIGYFEYLMDELNIQLVEGETIAVKARFWLPTWWPVDIDLGTIVVGAKLDFIRLRMDDDTDTATVRDMGGDLDQTFLDPSGDPNTDAHHTYVPPLNMLGFDGVDDRITLSEAAYLPAMDQTLDFTMMFVWQALQLGVSNGGGFVITNLTTPGAGALQFYRNTNNMACHYENWPDRNNASFAMGDLSDLAPHHACVIRGGTTLSFYWDSVFVTSYTNASNNCPFGAAGAPFAIGYNQNGPTYSKGNMCEFRIIARAITQGELTAIFDLLGI